MRRSEIDAALDELYARIPKMNGCDGRCWISCGPVDMSAREHARLREAGYRIMDPVQATLQAETYWCEALTEDRRCGAYRIRPLICRIWGAAERLRCPYGCTPEGGWLSDKDVDELLIEAEKIGGNGLLLRAPRDRAQAALIDKGNEGGIALRARHNVPAAFRPKQEEFPCPSCGFMLARPATVDGIHICGHCMNIVQLG